MRVLCVADPIERMKPATDSSLYVSRELLRRSHRVTWAIDTDLSWRGAQLNIEAPEILDAGMRDAAPHLSKPERLSIFDFDLVLLRKEPPFDQSYLKVCWFLAPYEKRIPMWNPPSVLLRHHEKMLSLDTLAREVLRPSEVIESCVTRNPQEAEAFVKSLHSEKVIVKPWMGHGGQNIQLYEKAELLPLLSDLVLKEDLVIQAFHEEVVLGGDRRVLFLGGKYLGDFVRLPKTGHFVSNLAQGGRAKKKPLNQKEQEIVRKLEAFFREEKMEFVGIDLIASRLSEVNVTSPTGLATLEDLEGKSFAGDVVNFLESKESLFR